MVHSPFPAPLPPKPISVQSVWGFVSCVWLTGIRAAVQTHRNAFELPRPSSPPRPGACPTRTPPSQPINFTTAQQKQDTDSQKKRRERERKERIEGWNISLGSAIRFASLNKDPWNSVNIFGLYWTHLVEVREGAGVARVGKRQRGLTVPARFDWSIIGWTILLLALMNLER